MAAGSYDYVIVGAGYALRRYVGRPMAPWPGPVDDASLARYVREHAQTAYHPAGTCRMAPAMAPSSTVNYGCTAWTACGWWTPR